jgi:hypothetical protein
MFISLKRERDVSISAIENKIVMEGQVMDSSDSVLGPGGANMKFYASLLPVRYNGGISTSENMLKLSGGTQLLLLFNAATDYTIDSLNFDGLLIRKKNATKCWIKLQKNRLQVSRKTYS